MSLTVKIKAGSKTKAILFASHLSIAECHMIIQVMFAPIFLFLIRIGKNGK
jgi:hypothetical protein